MEATCRRVKQLARSYRHFCTPSKLSNNLVLDWIQQAHVPLIAAGGWQIEVASCRPPGQFTKAMSLSKSFLGVPLGGSADSFPYQFSETLWKHFRGIFSAQQTWSADGGLSRQSAFTPNRLTIAILATCWVPCFLQISR